jgi:hypothetical protein
MAKFFSWCKFWLFPQFWSDCARSIKNMFQMNEQHNESADLLKEIKLLNNQSADLLKEIKKGIQNVNKLLKNQYALVNFYTMCDVYESNEVIKEYRNTCIHLKNLQEKRDNIPLSNFFIKPQHKGFFQPTHMSKAEIKKRVTDEMPTILQWVGRQEQRLEYVKKTEQIARSLTLSDIKKLHDVSLVLNNCLIDHTAGPLKCYQLIKSDWNVSDLKSEQYNQIQVKLAEHLSGLNALIFEELQYLNNLERDDLIS